jgi:ketosteroid isomerase-like protein
MEIDLYEYREAGERVVALGHVRGRGRTSQVELDFPAAWVCELRDGRITAMRAYTDQAEALRVAGLSESE